MHGDDTPERWRVVADCPDYEVSDCGNVRTWRTPGHPSRAAAPRPMRPHPHHAGHPRVTMRTATHQKVRRLLPRMVLEAFVGPCPPGMECCHWDGDPANNHLSNLRWDTKKANAADMVRHDRHQRGERNVNAKLTPDDVREIRRLHAERVPTRAIAERFGVDISNVRYITNGVTWRHVP